MSNDADVTMYFQLQVSFVAGDIGFTTFHGSDE